MGLSETPNMTGETTTIEIKRETWQRLNQKKKGPGDSFDEVIQRLLADE